MGSHITVAFRDRFCDRGPRASLGSTSGSNMMPTTCSILFDIKFTLFSQQCAEVLVADSRGTGKSENRYAVKKPGLACLDRAGED